jgi:hypothetical protein
MDKNIRYADLWALLRNLGFEFDTARDNKHRICEYAPTETIIVLADYPPDQPVREQILYGVRLQLENGGVMSREDFDRWVARLTGAGAANGMGRRTGSRMTGGR